jgi:peptide/nickel transport system permease protein
LPRLRIDRRLVGRIFEKKAAKVGTGLVVGVFAFIVIGTFLVPYAPRAIAGSPDSPPSFSHPFGTDFLGHDLLSQVVFGAYPTLMVGFVAAFAATGIGFVAGLLGGYYAKLELPVSIVTDTIMSFPVLVLLILLGSMFESTDQVIAAGLVLVLWPMCTRAVRPQVSSLKRAAYVDAARTSGLSDWRIVWGVIATAVASLALAYLILVISLAIVIASAVEFLGLGNVIEISWGSTLYYAQQYAFFAGDWWWILAPGLLLALLATGLALVGFSLEEIFNPRLRE